MAELKKAPVFVLGCPRSGTTLLYHMLLSAGGFAVYRAESNVFNFLEPRFGDLSVLGNRRRLMKVWLKSKLFERSGLDAAQVEAKVLAECRNAGDFLRIVMEEIARRQNVDRWAECTPEHILYLPAIKQTIPDALVIHIIRDGRDVALSLNAQGWIRPFPWEKEQGLMVAGIFWEWVVGRGREYGRMIGPDYLEVRFEELVIQPEKTLQRLGRFVDHDLDYGRIRRTAIGSVREPNTSFGEDGQQFEFNPVGRWKNRFPKGELDKFEGLLGNSLRELGYTLASTDHDLRHDSKLRRMRAFHRLYLDSKLWVRTKTRLSRFLDTRNPLWL